ncbi:diaminobutyrate aminotransferase apoenzyme [Agrococcus baldri]|uniref:Diaminobutyrate--2-oxoglutarate transaminase n=1 Tax=Agrococcus baldri TaxID=153730 RepID=A0AA94HLI2_9MICO|nr:diaminobutyrate--2-oxoglutarate transaminase [Agrococcus baldri]SFS01524.1 diaminobutyrate aminotransferase apoenzyme [Agrococcus baldri]
MSTTTTTPAETPAGGIGDTSAFERRESAVRSYARSWPAVFASASGAEQVSEQGETYLDFFAGAGALNYGHNHPMLQQVAIDYLASGAVVHSLDTHTPAKRAFLEAFERHILAPRGLEHRVLFPGPTGTNAVEAALKTARKATGRRDIVSFTNAFHGMTLGSLAVTGNAKKRAAAGVPLPFGVTAPYEEPGMDAIAWLERVWSDSGSGIDLPAGVIVEPVQGEGGLRAASPEWLRRLADLCKRFDVVLILDEIQAGCGRTGTFFAFEEAGITPDIITLSKSLSGLGMPMALTLIRPDLDVWQPGEHNGTFRGFAPAFATATAAIETFWADGAFAESVQAKAALLDAGLQQIAEHSGATLRGRGMLRGVRFEDPAVAGRAAAAAFERKLLVETSGSNDEVIKLMPPLTITDEQLQRGIALLDEAVRAATA